MEPPRGLFPAILLEDRPTWRLALRVESVADFLVAQGMEETPIWGPVLGQLRAACLGEASATEVWVVERHGFRGLELPEAPAGRTEAVLWHQEVFRRRKRHFVQDEDGFTHARNLVRMAVDDLGTGWAADLFFAAEREYWTRETVRPACARPGRTLSDWAGAITTTTPTAPVASTFLD